MKYLLMVFGYSEFQAANIAPWLWFFLAGAIVYTSCSVYSQYKRAMYYRRNKK